MTTIYVKNNHGRLQVGLAPIKPGGTLLYSIHEGTHFLEPTWRDSFEPFSTSYIEEFPGKPTELDIHLKDLDDGVYKYTDRKGERDYQIEVKRGGRPKAHFDVILEDGVTKILPRIHLEDNTVDVVHEDADNLRDTSFTIQCRLGDRVIAESDSQLDFSQIRRNHSGEILKIFVEFPPHLKRELTGDDEFNLYIP